MRVWWLTLPRRTGVSSGLVWSWSAWFSGGFWDLSLVLPEWPICSVGRNWNDMTKKKNSQLLSLSAHVRTAQNRMSKGWSKTWTLKVVQRHTRRWFKYSYSSLFLWVDSQNNRAFACLNCMNSWKSIHKENSLHLTQHKQCFLHCKWLKYAFSARSSYLNWN